MAERNAGILSPADFERRIRRLAWTAFAYALPLLLLLAICQSPVSWAAPLPDKDQSRIGGENRITPERGGSGELLQDAPGLLDQGAPGKSDMGIESMEGPEGLGDDENIPLEDLIAQDIPNIQAVELTPEKARKALDAFEKINGKYDDKGLEEYPTLQEFADSTEAGRRMQEEIRAFGFRNVGEWNLIIMNIGFAYSSLLEGSDEAIEEQIREIESDAAIPPEKKKALIRNLRVLIPSDNNRKIVKDLMDDPVYSRKLKLLDQEE